MPAISMITPNKDQAEYLPRAMDSVLAQNLKPLEYVVVDGGSSDGSLELLSKCDRRFRLLKVASGDLAAAVNEGIRQTNGEVIGWLNSDDMLYPGALDAVDGFFERNTDIDIVYGDAHYIDEDDDIIGRYPVKRWSRQRLQRRCFLCQPAVFFRRRVLQACGVLNEQLYYRPDYDFWLRLDAAGARFRKIDTVLAGRRQHAGNCRAESDDPAAVIESILTLRQLTKRVPTRWYIHYGKLRAEADGIDRDESSEYDRTVLHYAAAAMEGTDPHASVWTYRHTLFHYCLREFSDLAKRPYYACRFLPPPLRTVVQRYGRRKLFRLRNYPPCELRSAPPTRVLQPRKSASRISIVTPSWNQGRFLERTLTSVLDQDYPRLEYIVQDGGSTDQSVEIIRRYEHRLAAWQSVPDQGQTNALNLGMQRTTGEIMAYLNSDDLLLPGSLDYVAGYFQTHPDVDVLYGHRVLIDEEGREIGRWVLPPHDDRAIPWADYIPQETMFWRRRAWEAVGGQLDESFDFAMDWDLILRFRDAGLRFQRVPRFLGAFRVTDDQKTNRLMKTVGRLEIKRLRRRVLGRIPSRREIRRAIRPYLRRHLLYDKMYNFGFVRYE